MINKARETRIREKIRGLSLEEKAVLVAGGTRAATAALPDRDIRSLRIEECLSGAVFNDPDGGFFAPSADVGTVYPSPACMARCFDTELVRAVAAQMADEYRSRDVEIVCAPLLTVKRDPADGMDAMRLSEDPVLTGELAAAFVNGMADRGVTVCLGGYGLPCGEDMTVSAEADIDPRTLNAVYLKSAETAMEHCDLVAVSPVGGSFRDDRHRRALRGRMDFRGAVMDLTGACADPVAAVASGVDYVTVPGKGGPKELVSAVESGRLSAERLDEAAMRVLYLYYECVGNSPVVLKADPDKSRALAFRSARESMVLLKNEDGFFPLEEGGRIAVIGAPAAAGCGILPGCYRSSLEGGKLLDSLSRRYPGVLYAEGYDAAGNTNPRLIEEARKALREAGKGILAVALPAGSRGIHRDREDLRLPDGLLKLADLLLAEGLPMGCVLLDDSPVEMPFDGRMKAALLAGYAGEATAEAAAEIMLGSVNPSGRLAQTWPVRYEDLPVSEAGDASFPELRYNGYGLYESLGTRPLYRFGYGLNYTSLRFIGAKCERKTIIGERQRISITYSIENLSDRTVISSLQFYVGLRDDPHKRLAAFTRIGLLPGEVKIGQTDVIARSLNEYDPDTDRNRLSAGEYLVSISHSSGEYGALGYFALEAGPRDGYRAERWPEAGSLKNGKQEAKEEEEAYGFSLESTLEEISGTFAGRALYEDVLSRLKSEPDCAGEEFIDRILNLPVRMLPAASRNAVTAGRVKGTVDIANGKALRGMVEILAGR